MDGPESCAGLEDRSISQENEGQDFILNFRVQFYSILTKYQNVDLRNNRQYAGAYLLAYM
jgi:hypothetical protein